MSSNRSIASLAVSALTVSLFAATLMAADAPVSGSAPAAATAPAAKADTGVVVKNASASTAPGRKTCEDLKTEIDGKLKAKGVKTFTLDIVPAADVKTEKIVGSCEAGAKKIIYKRG
jgi:hypothetical protein